MRLERNLLTLLIFLFPVQLALHFWPVSSFVFGIRVDYLAPTIYLTDILVFILFVLWLKNDRKFLHRKVLRERKFLLVFLALSIINLGLSTSFYPSLYKWIKFLEFIFFSFYISSRIKILDPKLLGKTLFASLTFFCLIGVTQVILGRTLGGPFYLLGERLFTTGTPGIALFSLGGQEHLRAYSTFSHPNSLAGFIVVTSFIILALGKFRRTLLNSIGILIVLACLFLTTSLSAFFVLFLLLIFKFFWLKERKYRKIISVFFVLLIAASLVLPIVSQKVLASKIDFSQSVTERLNLAFLSGKMLNERFLLGEGLNTFIINSPRLNEINFGTWVLQPVHNIFLLTAGETGIFGLIFFSFIFFKFLIVDRSRNKIYFTLAFLFVLITGLFDHYWLSLQQNLLLLSLLFGLAVARQDDTL